MLPGIISFLPQQPHPRGHACFLSLLGKRMDVAKASRLLPPDSLSKPEQATVSHLPSPFLPIRHRLCILEALSGHLNNAHHECCSVDPALSDIRNSPLPEAADQLTTRSVLPVCHQNVGHRRSTPGEGGHPSNVLQWQRRRCLGPSKGRETENFPRQNHNSAAVRQLVLPGHVSPSSHSCGSASRPAVFPICPCPACLAKIPHRVQTRIRMGTYSLTRGRRRRRRRRKKHPTRPQPSSDVRTSYSD